MFLHFLSLITQADHMRSAEFAHFYGNRRHNNVYRDSSQRKTTTARTLASLSLKKIK
jgi:hypothetical protein